jgi:hypothetical protein
VASCPRMLCGHAFCCDCWTQHFKTGINDGKARTLRCVPADGPSLLVLGLILLHACQTLDRACMASIPNVPQQLFAGPLCSLTRSLSGAWLPSVARQRMRRWCCDC